MLEFFKVLADDTASGGAGEPAKQNPWMLVILGVVLVAFIVMTVIQNRKRKKQMAQEQEKKDMLCPGTKVITIGGVMGVVTQVNYEENSFVLDSEGTLMKFDKRAIYQMDLPESAKKVEPAKEVVKEEVKEEVKAEPKKAKKSTKKSAKKEVEEVKEEVKEEVTEEVKEEVTEEVKEEVKE